MFRLLVLLLSLLFDSKLCLVEDGLVYVYDHDLPVPPSPLSNHFFFARLRFFLLYLFSVLRFVKFAGVFFFFFFFVF